MLHGSNASGDGERVRGARERRGWSQRMLAARSRVSPSTVSRIEDGLVTPDLATIRKIAEALNLSADDFVSGRAEKAAPIPTVGTVRRTEDVDLPVYRAHAGRVDLTRAEGTPDVFSIRASRTYVLEVTGDCLYPSHQLVAGDRLFIDRSAEPATGDLVVARIQDDTFLGEWLGNGGVVRIRLSDGQLREARVHDVAILGVVTDQVRSMRDKRSRGLPGWLRVSREE